MLVKEMLSQMQLISARPERDLDKHDDDDGDDDDYHEYDRAYRAINCGEGVSRQVNILASVSRRLLEGDTQKQVNGCCEFICKL